VAPEQPRPVGDFYRRLVFARDNGTNFVVLTGQLEPMQNRAFLQFFAAMNAALPSRFEAIEIQTTGVFLDEAGLDFLQDEIGVTTVALSIADLSSRKNNFDLQGTPEKLRFDLVDLCDRIKARNLTLRICANLTDCYHTMLPGEFLAMVGQLGADQLVLRQMFAESGGTTEKDEWVRQHALPAEPLVKMVIDRELKEVPLSEARQRGLTDKAIFEPDVMQSYGLVYDRCRVNDDLTVWDLTQYILKHGHALDILPYGATRYSIHGMSTVIDQDCMASGNGGKQTLRYLILQPDCHLRTRWDDEGSLLF